MEKPLNIHMEAIIKIIALEEICLGEEPEKDSPIAYFLCSIEWCPIDTDSHVADLSEELRSTDKIYISALTKREITSGIYRKIDTYRRHELFEKVA